MKRKLAFLNVFFALAILGALFSQSAHSIAHYIEQQQERHCTHDSYSKASITHTHAQLEHCFVCDFTFAHSVTPDLPVFTFFTTAPTKAKPFSARYDVPVSFCGSLFALRAPPVFSV